MTPMSPREWAKHDWARVDTFISRYVARETFELTDGTSVSFTANTAVVSLLTNKNIEAVTSVRLHDSLGNEYRLSRLGKTSSFGGKAPGAILAKENLALSSLVEQLKAISPPVTLAVCGEEYRVREVHSTPGTPKSDFHFLDESGEEVLWVSHKDGSCATDFQQWGGFTGLHWHPEIQQWKDDLSQVYPDGYPRGETSRFRSIKDDDLKRLAVYGTDYGNKYSRNNIQIVLQGPVKLEDKKTHFELMACHSHFNGELLTGDYEPVLTVRFTSDRKLGTMPKTRGLIAPSAGRKLIPF